MKNTPGKTREGFARQQQQGHINAGQHKMEGRGCAWDKAQPQPVVSLQAASPGTVITSLLLVSLKTLCRLLRGVGVTSRSLLPCETAAAHASCTHTHCASSGTCL